jgi:hypothetical protein
MLPGTDATTAGGEGPGWPGASSLGCGHLAADCDGEAEARTRPAIWWGRPDART